MLFIATATVAVLERGIEYDGATTFPVTHIVDALDADEAKSIVKRHYEQQSDRSSPYGSLYAVSNEQAFAPLSLASLALPPV